MKKCNSPRRCFLVTVSNLITQTKVSGIIVDKSKQAIPFANVAFKGSNEGTVSNEDGRFYLESVKIIVF
jgi:hypothetical protein